MLHTGFGPRPELVDVAAVDEQWLTAVLRHAGAITDSRVVGIERTPVGAGQVGDTYRYALRYDQREPSAPDAVVAKMPASDESSRAAAVAYRLYEREVRFYQQLATRVGIRTPHCFHADIDTATGQFVLVFEDLAPAASVDQVAGFTVDHARTAISQLASLHAPVWNDPELESSDWLNQNRVQAHTLVDVSPALFDAFAARYQHSLEPEWLAVVHQLKAHLKAFWLDQPRPWTVFHGDFRPDNMLFDARGGAIPLATVDWQTIGLGPGLVDLAFLLGTGLDTTTRRECEDALVRAYHEVLVAGGVRDYDWERCWRDYRRYAAYTIYFIVPSAMMVEQTERGDTIFLSMIRRGAAHVADLDSLSLLAG